MKRTKRRTEPKPGYAKLLKARQRLLAKLAECPPVLRGTIRLHGNKCGNKKCRCHDPKDPIRHGPYHYLSHRYQDKCQTILLNAAKLPHAREWVENYKELIQMVYELSQVNFKILRYHYVKLDEGNLDGV